MSPAVSRIIADPNRDLIGIMANGMVVTRNVSEGPRAGQTSASRREEPENNRSGANPGGLRPTSEANLSDAEKAVLEELKHRDREVRLHEQKHMSAAGPLAKGGPTYEYAIGPDGKPYAIGGKVRIDTSAVAGNPEATEARANQIQRAATAPGDPSGPDLSVARDAANLRSQASREYRMNAPDAKDDISHNSYALRMWG
ncbi:MAG TPA: hypothetical protein DEA96_14665 [Leptospiraceae bacterium]|nr:hypothetical protein [Spirochaetaceae bacterium]HBS06208.1 hypothetical protein [Leptospiraceae bacterium]|tara:strand:- start:6073 stop:6669 length:597 start_codon:yes stop_codon:yes gene_type:complete